MSVGTYIQLLDKDKDWFYIEIGNGEPSWLLPPQTDFSEVKYLTHASEENKLYYENTETNEVAWVLPSEMSKDIQKCALSLCSKTRTELEKVLDEEFPEKYSHELMTEIEAFFAGSGSESESHGSQQNTNDGEDVENSISVENNNTHSSTVSQPATVTTMVIKSESFIVKCGNLSKLAMRSGRNWKARFFILTPFYLAYYENEGAAPKIDHTDGTGVGGSDSYWKSLTQFASQANKPKGHIQITADSTVESINSNSNTQQSDSSKNKSKKNSEKEGFSLQISNEKESILLSVETEQIRNEWISAIQTTIIAAKNTVINTSQQIVTNKQNKATKTSKLFILHNNVITIHKDAKTVTTIEGMFCLSVNTVVERFDDADCVTTLANSPDGGSTCSSGKNTVVLDKLSFQFAKPEYSHYRTWKNAIVDIVYATTPSAGMNEVSDTIAVAADNGGGDENEDIDDVSTAEEPSATFAKTEARAVDDGSGDDDDSSAGAGSDQDDDEEDDKEQQNRDHNDGTVGSNRASSYISEGSSDSGDALQPNAAVVPPTVSSSSQSQSPASTGSFFGLERFGFQRASSGSMDSSSSSAAAISTVVPPAVVAASAAEVKSIVSVGPKDVQKAQLLHKMSTENLNFSDDDDDDGRSEHSSSSGGASVTVSDPEETSEVTNEVFSPAPPPPAWTPPPLIKAQGAKTQPIQVETRVVQSAISPGTKDEFSTPERRPSGLKKRVSFSRPNTESLLADETIVVAPSVVPANHTPPSAVVSTTGTVNEKPKSSLSSVASTALSALEVLKLRKSQKSSSTVSDAVKTSSSGSISRNSSKTSLSTVVTSTAHQQGEKSGLSVATVGEVNSTSATTLLSALEVAAARKSRRMSQMTTGGSTTTTTITATSIADKQPQPTQKLAVDANTLKGVSVFGLGSELDATSDSSDGGELLTSPSAPLLVPVSKSTLPSESIGSRKPFQQSTQFRSSTPTGMINDDDDDDDDDDDRRTGEQYRGIMHSRNSMVAAERDLKRTALLGASATNSLRLEEENISNAPTPSTTAASIIPSAAGTKQLSALEVMALRKSRKLSGSSNGSGQTSDSAAFSSPLVKRKSMSAVSAEVPRYTEDSPPSALSVPTNKTSSTFAAVSAVASNALDMMKIRRARKKSVTITAPGITPPSTVMPAGADTSIIPVKSSSSTSSAYVADDRTVSSVSNALSANMTKSNVLPAKRNSVWASPSTAPTNTKPMRGQSEDTGSVVSDISSLQTGSAPALSPKLTKTKSVFSKRSSRHFKASSSTTSTKAPTSDVHSSADKVGGDLSSALYSVQIGDDDDGDDNDREKPKSKQYRGGVVASTTTTTSVPTATTPSQHQLHQQDSPKSTGNKRYDFSALKNKKKSVKLAAAATPAAATAIRKSQTQSVVKDDRQERSQTAKTKVIEAIQTQQPQPPEQKLRSVSERFPPGALQTLGNNSANPSPRLSQSSISGNNSVRDSPSVQILNSSGRVQNPRNSSPAGLTSSPPIDSPNAVNALERAKQRRATKLSLSPNNNMHNTSNNSISIPPQASPHLQLSKQHSGTFAPASFLSNSPLAGMFGGRKQSQRGRGDSMCSRDGSPSMSSVGGGMHDGTPRSGQRRRGLSESSTGGIGGFGGGGLHNFSSGTANTATNNSNNNNHASNSGYCFDSEISQYDRVYNEFNSETKLKPLVRIVFDVYCVLQTPQNALFSSESAATFTGESVCSSSSVGSNGGSDVYIMDNLSLQNVFYDFGVYYSTDDLLRIVKGFSTVDELNKRLVLTYEEFMVLWRSVEPFSSYKLNNPYSIRRNVVTQAFKKHDYYIAGQIKAVYFNYIHRDLCAQNIITKQHMKGVSLQDLLLTVLDPDQTGFISYNRFASWIDSEKPQSENKITKSTISRFFSGRVRTASNDSLGSDSVHRSASPVTILTSGRSRNRSNSEDSLASANMLPRKSVFPNKKSSLMADITEEGSSSGGLLSGGCAAVNTSSGEQSAVLTFEDNEEYKRRVLMETANEMKLRGRARIAQHSDDGEGDDEEQGAKGVREGDDDEKKNKESHQQDDDVAGGPTQAVVPNQHFISLPQSSSSTRNRAASGGSTDGDYTTASEDSAAAIRRDRRQRNDTSSKQQQQQQDNDDGNYESDHDGEEQYDSFPVVETSVTAESSTNMPPKVTAPVVTVRVPLGDEHNKAVKQNQAAAMIHRRKSRFLSKTSPLIGKFVKQPVVLETADEKEEVIEAVKAADVTPVVDSKSTHESATVAAVSGTINSESGQLDRHEAPSLAAPADSSAVATSTTVAESYVPSPPPPPSVVRGKSPIVLSSSNNTNPDNSNSEFVNPLAAGRRRSMTASSITTVGEPVAATATDAVNNVSEQASESLPEETVVKASGLDSSQQTSHVLPPPPPPPPPPTPKVYTSFSAVDGVLVPPPPPPPPVARSSDASGQPFQSDSGAFSAPHNMKAPSGLTVPPPPPPPSLQQVQQQKQRIVQRTNYTANRQTAKATFNVKLSSLTMDHENWASQENNSDKHKHDAPMVANTFSPIPQNNGSSAQKHTGFSPVHIKRISVFTQPPLPTSPYPDDDDEQDGFAETYNHISPGRGVHTVWGTDDHPDGRANHYSPASSSLMGGCDDHNQKMLALTVDSMLSAVFESSSLGQPQPCGQPHDGQNQPQSRPRSAYLVQSHTDFLSDTQHTLAATTERINIRLAELNDQPVPAAIHHQQQGHSSRIMKQAVSGAADSNNSPSKVKERSQLEFYHLLQKEKLEIEIKLRNIDELELAARSKRQLHEESEMKRILLQTNDSIANVHKLRDAVAAEHNKTLACIAQDRVKAENEYQAFKAHERAAKQLQSQHLAQVANFAHELSLQQKEMRKDKQKVLTTRQKLDQLLAQLNTTNPTPEYAYHDRPLNNSSSNPTNSSNRQYDTFSSLGTITSASSVLSNSSPQRSRSAGRNVGNSWNSTTKVRAKGFDDMRAERASSRSRDGCGRDYLSPLRESAVQQYIPPRHQQQSHQQPLNSQQKYQQYQQWLQTQQQMQQSQMPHSQQQMVPEPVQGYYQGDEQEQQSVKVQQYAAPTSHTNSQLMPPPAIQQPGRRQNAHQTADSQHKQQQQQRHLLLQQQHQQLLTEQQLPQQRQQQQQEQQQEQQFRNPQHHQFETSDNNSRDQPAVARRLMDSPVTKTLSQSEAPSSAATPTVPNKAEEVAFVRPKVEPLSKRWASMIGVHNRHV